MKFRKKPVTIEALPLTDENAGEIVRWIIKGGADAVMRGGPGGGSIGGTVMIPTLEGNMTADVGDWIIRGVQGEFYPCTPEIFAMTYEPVEDES